MVPGKKSTYRFHRSMHGRTQLFHLGDRLEFGRAQRSMIAEQIVRRRRRPRVLLLLLLLLLLRDRRLELLRHLVQLRRQPGVTVERMRDGGQARGSLRAAEPRPAHPAAREPCEKVRVRAGTRARGATRRKVDVERLIGRKEPRVIGGGSEWSAIVG